MRRLLRLPADVGLLTNQRMAVEIGVGLAHLSDRTLSMPLDEPIGVGPGGILEGADSGPPSSIGDLFDVPMEVADAEEWRAASQVERPERPDWPALCEAVFVASDEVDLQTRQFTDFANGRSAIATLSGPLEEATNVELVSRPLSWYSYFFFVPGEERHALYDLIGRVAPKREFGQLADRVRADLGRFNAAHIRRTDILDGIPASRRVTPREIGENLAEILPRDQLLVVCTEAASDSPVFGPLRDLFPETVFLTDLLLTTRWRSDLLGLPRHDDHALGLLTQEVARHADRFVGTVGSTFTGAIQRCRLLADPTSPFLYVADYTPPGPRFSRGSYEDITDGTFSWNRQAYGMSPDVLAWFREWPESRADRWPR